VPIVSRISGWIRLSCGTSVFWIPRDKKQAILDGIECLRMRDAELFSKLSEGAQLIFCYAGSTKTANNGTRLYGIHDRYIQIGPEGIALFVVQSLFCYEASPSFNQCRRTESQAAAVRAAPWKTLDWMCKHSFNQGLIDSYRGAIGKAEERRRLKSLAA
jgi:hypothetical protein